MRRRTILGISCAYLATPLLARAQPAGRTYRVAVATLAPRSTPFNVAMERRFRELGYVEGKNFALQYHSSAGSPDKLSGLAAELAGTRPDVVIVTGSENVLRRFRQALGPTPIVMIAVNFDPVERNFVASLARPGGNITGVVFREVESAAKRLDLLREVLPKAARIAALYDIATKDQLHATEEAAKRLSITILGYEMRGNPYDFAAAMSAAAKAKAQAVQALSSAAFFNLRDKMIGAALEQRLPVFANPNYAETGALVSFGANFPHMWERAAEYADRIMKGTNPAEMPVEQPTKFELIVNLKTARTLGIAIPQPVLLRADRVIE